MNITSRDTIPQHSRPSAAPGYSMPFGKHKGQDIREVPDGALHYYLGWSELRPEARRQFEAELARRANGEPPHPDPGAERPDTVTHCAIDLVMAGEATLFALHPNRQETIRKAGQVLRNCLGTVQDHAASGDEDDPIF